MKRAKNMNNRRLKIKTLLSATATIAALALSGCTVGPKYHTPTATVQPPPATYKESPAQFTNSGDWKVAQPQDAMLHGKWWEIYNDSELNALEEQLIVNNQNVKQAFENFMAARTLVAQARSQLFPTVGVAPSYQRTRTSANINIQTGSSSSSSGGSTTIPNLQSQLFSLPV